MMISGVILFSKYNYTFADLIPRKPRIIANVDYFIADHR